jgi:hypothetical protein
MNQIQQLVLSASQDRVSDNKAMCKAQVVCSCIDNVPDLLGHLLEIVNHQDVTLFQISNLKVLPGSLHQGSQGPAKLTFVLGFFEGCEGDRVVAVNHHQPCHRVLKKDMLIFN